MPKQSRSEGKDMFNVDRLFSVMTTATIIIEIVACIVLIGAGVGYLLVLTGYYDIIAANIDLFILLFLLGGGITFFILIAFIGFFIRIQDNVKRFVLADGIGHVVTASREGVRVWDTRSGTEVARLAGADLEDARGEAVELVAVHPEGFWEPISGVWQPG
ncbi:MAG: hypothetical protein ACFFCO_11740, partial [Promethearchaeota archaeon]